MFDFEKRSLLFGKASKSAFVIVLFAVAISAFAGKAEDADKNVILFSSDSLDKLGNKIRVLCKINADGSGWKQLTSFEDSRVRRSSVSSVGKKIAFLQKFRIHVRDWDGSNDVDITPIGREHFLPAWSPDGKEIAFTTDRDDNAEIYVMNADGSNGRNLSWSPMSSDMSPTWSPDGKTIAFISNRNGKKFELFAMDEYGFHQKLIASLDGNIRAPAWSVNNKIAFALEKNGVSNLYTIDPDGANLTPITNDSCWNGQPAWDADGIRLAFVSTKSGNPNIWTLDTTTGKRRNVTNSKKKDSFFPTWVPRQRSSKPLTITKANVSGAKLPRPRMLFTKKDLPAIRKRLSMDPYRKTWNSFLKVCDAMCVESSVLDKKISKSIADIRTGGKPSLYNRAPWINAVFNLALAYQITGNEKYGRQATKWLVEAGRLYALYHGRMQFTYPVSCAYDWLYDRFTPDERASLTSLLCITTRIYFNHIMQNNQALGPLSEGISNIGVFNAADIGPMALTLAGEPGFKANWLAGAIRLTAFCFNNWIGENGDCREGFSYFAAPIKQILPFLVSLKVNNLAPNVFDSNLKKFPRWMAISAAHGATETVNIGDCDSMRLWIPAGLLRIYPDDKCLAALWDRGKRGKSPKTLVQDILWWRPANATPLPLPKLPNVAHFTRQSYVVMRSGYAYDDPMMTLCNPIIPGHTHAECGSVLLYGYGTRFLVDPGQGVSAAQMHNNILINGRGRGKGTLLSDSVLKIETKNKLGAIAVADLKEGFARRADGYLDYKIPSGWVPIERGSRFLAMVYDKDDAIPPYFVIYDDVKVDDNPNKFESPFLLDMDKTVKIEDHRFIIENAYNGPWFAPGKGVKGTIDYSFNCEKAGNYDLWLYLRRPAKAFAININGKQYPTGWARGTTTRSESWQWKKLATTSRKPIKFKLSGGKNSLKVGLCGNSVFAKIILSPSDVDFYGEGPNPKLPPNSIALPPSKGKPTMQMVLKQPPSRHPKALLAFLNPEPVKLTLEKRRYKTRFYGQQLVILPQVVAERNVVNPKFLVFVYPYKDGMEQPVISTALKDGLIHAEIKWKHATDSIQTQENDEPGKKAKLTITRKGADGKTMHLSTGLHF